MAQERGDIDYVVSENGEDADMIRVLREYAEGGNDLIVGEVYPVEREARRVTQDYPNVAFLLGSPPYTGDRADWCRFREGTPGMLRCGS